jgi:biotin carboxyl carrier protein
LPEIRAPIAGTLFKVHVREGDVVAEGAVVAVIESMKLEIPVAADASGTVTRSSNEGDPVAEGDVLVVLE